MRYSHAWGRSMLLPKGIMKQIIYCDQCKKQFERVLSQIKQTNFCSRVCSIKAMRKRLGRKFDGI